MDENKLLFTKYGLINFLLSIIPIFPAWSIFLGIPFNLFMEYIYGKNEFSFNLSLWIIILLILNKIEFKKQKLYFRIFSFLIYSFINYSILLNLVGYNLYINGDGQTFLLVYYSAPFASLSLLLLGFFTDIQIAIYNKLSKF
ncbi:MAG: hypothetical protein ACOVNU_07505 [Candidatus Kapaibacteriota bacterium]|jgi:hypothetical protein